jgi:hypothetical protein
MLDRNDSPWYPTAVRLFRQRRRGQWSDPVQRVAAELKRFVEAAAAATRRSRSSS